MPRATCGSEVPGRVCARIQVASPFDETVLHVFELVHGGGRDERDRRRSWLDAGGRPAHHLLDPATGRPAFNRSGPG